MLTLLILVAGLLTCANTYPNQRVMNPFSSQGKQELSKRSLQYVYVFFRHGIRSPLKETYPADPYKKIYHHFFKTPLGQLTKPGMKEMHEVGKRLANIYGKFIDGYSEEKVRASSTETSRTIMSALCVMAGLFPSKKPLFEDLGTWQPIPIWQDTREFDKVYLYNDPDFPQLALKQCPRYGKMIQEGYDIVKEKDQDQSRSEIYQLLRENTKNTAIYSIDEAYTIYDILEMESLNGLALPDWALMRRPSLGNKPLFPDLMRPLQVDWFYKCQWLRKDPEMLAFYSGPLFYNINDKFSDKINNKETKERFRYHNTHDDTILTFRWALGYDDPDFEVQPGDGIAFELHKVHDKHYVQVVYYHSLEPNKQFREVLNFPDCKSPCPYDEFAQQYTGLSPQEWETKCHGGSVMLSNDQK